MKFLIVIYWLNQSTLRLAPHPLSIHTGHEAQLWMPTEQCWGSSEGSFLAPPDEIVWWSHSKWLFSCYLFILLHQPLLHPHNYPIPLITNSVQLLSCVLRPHGLQRVRPPCPSSTPAVYSDSCASSWWCHPTISSSVTPSPPTLNLSKHQNLFKWLSSLNQVAKVLEFQLQRQVFQWIFRTDFL